MCGIRGTVTPTNLRTRSRVAMQKAVLPGRPVGTARQNSRDYNFTTSVRRLFNLSSRICQEKSTVIEERQQRPTAFKSLMIL
jgi:hypothetical protein